MKCPHCSHKIVSWLLERRDSFDVGNKHDYKCPSCRDWIPQNHWLEEGAYDVKKDSDNNGGSTDYYKLNPQWKDAMDIIEEREMNYSQGNIFKVAMTFNIGRHTGTDEIRELNKIIYFAEREIARIKEDKMEVTFDE